MTRKQFYIKGLKEGIPIMLVYFAVSFSFGILAVSAGMTPFQASLMSLVNLTSAGQFAGLTTMAAMGSYVELILTQFVINLRYSLMSLSLSQKLDRKESILFRFLAAFGVTDEIFSISVAQEGKISAFYNLGAMSVAIPGWVLGTLTGSFLGNILPGSVVSALSVALYGMFIGIIVPPVKKDRAVAFVITLAIVVSCIFHYVPFFNRISDGFVIVLTTILVSAIGARLFPKENL